MGIGGSAGPVRVNRHGDGKPEVGRIVGGVAHRNRSDLPGADIRRTGLSRGGNDRKGTVVRTDQSQDHSADIGRKRPVFCERKDMSIDDGTFTGDAPGRGARRGNLSVIRGEAGPIFIEDQRQGHTHVGCVRSGTAQGNGGGLPGAEIGKTGVADRLRSWRGFGRGLNIRIGLILGQDCIDIRKNRFQCTVFADNRGCGF